jgi:hypothetical protein
MTALFWTPEKEKILKAMWDRGNTASEISERIGASRNAVLGKARRLNLAVRIPNEFRHRNRANTAPKPKPEPARFKIKRPGKEPEKEPVYKSTAEAVMELKPGTCRWPSGLPHLDRLAFCSEPVYELYSYCLRHCYNAYSNFEEIQIKKTKQREERKKNGRGC